MQNSYVFNAQSFIGKFSHYAALERVDEAGTEDEFLNLSVINGNCRCSSARCNKRHFIGGYYRSSCKYAAAGSRANNSHYFILSNQLGYGVAGFSRLGFVVAFYYNKLFTVNAACFVNLVNSKF